MSRTNQRMVLYHHLLGKLYYSKQRLTDHSRKGDRKLIRHMARQFEAENYVIITVFGVNLIPYTKL